MTEREMLYAENDLLKERCREQTKGELCKDCMTAFDCKFRNGDIDFDKLLTAEFPEQTKYYIKCGDKKVCFNILDNALDFVPKKFTLDNIRIYDFNGELIAYRKSMPYEFNKEQYDIWYAMMFPFRGSEREKQPIIYTDNNDGYYSDWIWVNE